MRVRSFFFSSSFFNLCRTLLVIMTAISTAAAKPQKNPFPLDVDLRCEIGGRVILSGYTFYDNCSICRSSSAPRVECTETDLLVL